MTIKFRYHTNVNHVKVTVFAGPTKDNLANCGQLVMLHGEWKALWGMLDKAGETDVILEEEKHT